MVNLGYVAHPIETSILLKGYLGNLVCGYFKSLHFGSASCPEVIRLVCFAIQICGAWWLRRFARALRDPMPLG